MDKKPRPLLVTIIGALYALVGLLTLIGGVLLLLGYSVPDPEFSGIIGAGGIASIVAGIVTLLIAAGFLRGWSVMWYLGVIFSVIGLIIGVASVLVSGMAGVVVVAIELIILFYLFKTNVKEFFLH